MYKKEDRQIFRYFNGEKEVAADPIQLSVRLASSYPKESSLEHDWKLLDTNDEQAMQAFDRIAVYARNVFRMKEWDEETETGVTTAEALGVLVRFVGYVDECKKKLFGQLISPPTTAAASSCGEDVNPTTNCSLDSGSITNELSAAGA